MLSLICHIRRRWLRINSRGLLIIAIIVVIMTHFMSGSVRSTFPDRRVESDDGNWKPSLSLSLVNCCLLRKIIMNNKSGWAVGMIWSVGWPWAVPKRSYQWKTTDGWMDGSPDAHMMKWRGWSWWSGTHEQKNRNWMTKWVKSFQGHPIFFFIITFLPLLPLRSCQTTWLTDSMDKS